MITELTQEQIDKFPYYVQKWTDIGLNTEPCNVPETIKQIKAAYKVAKIAEPQYFFYFSSPMASSHAIFIVEALDSFTKDYKDTALYSDTEKYLKIFESVFEQYSKQYDLWKHDKMRWNEDTKARMLSFVSKAYADPTHEAKLKQHMQNMLLGAHDAAWLSFYDFFYQEFNLECTHVLIPSFEIAKNCGWWSAYETAAFFQDRPTMIKITEDKILHCEDGPCITYADGEEVYCLENFWFPRHVVMEPNLITPEEISNETNAEKRRILLERYKGGEDNGGGYLAYFKDIGATVIDRDMVIVDPETQTTMPRMLVECPSGDQKDLFLVGSDGSTERVYVMPVSNRDRVERQFGTIKTCRQAHQLISGLDESKCMAQS